MNTMEYVYSALLLHSAKKEINEANVQDILKAAVVNDDAVRVTAMFVALEIADMSIAIKNATAAQVAMAAAPAGAAAAPKAEEKLEEKGVSEEEAAAGIGALFG